MSTSAERVGRVPTGLIGRWRLAWVAGRDVIVNAGSMMGTTLVTAALGAVFWWLAAREFPQSAVGLAGAAISAMTLLGTFATLGLNTVLMGEFGRGRSGVRELTRASLAASGLAGIVLGALFAVAAPALSAELAPFFHRLAYVLIFAAGVGLTATTLVLDQALIGLGRGGLQLWRNSLFAAIKLGLLLIPVLALRSALAQAIYGAWMLGNALSLVAIYRPDRRPDADRSARPGRAILRGLGRSAFGHHTFNLALKAPMLALPVIVVSVLSSRLNATFYIAYMLAGFVYMISISLSTVLYAAGHGRESGLRQKFRLSLCLSAGSALAANIIILVAAAYLLEIFGSAYATGAGTLRILGVAALPLILKNHFVAACRIAGRVGRTAPLVWLGAGLEMVLAAIGAKLGGLEGLSLAWLIALVVEAAAMAPTVYRVSFVQARSPLAGGQSA